MNTRISAIATSVMLVTVMPRYSRPFFSPSFKANPAPGEGAGPTLRTVRNTRSGVQ